MTNSYTELINQGMPVIYDDWNFHPEANATRNYNFKVSISVHIRNKIPYVIFGQGAWIDLVHNSWLTAVAVSGKVFYVNG